MYAHNIIRNLTEHLKLQLSIKCLATKWHHCRLLSPIFLCALTRIKDLHILALNTGRKQEMCTNTYFCICYKWEQHIKNLGYHSFKDSFYAKYAKCEHRIFAFVLCERHKLLQARDFKYRYLRGQITLISSNSTVSYHSNLITKPNIDATAAGWFNLCTSSNPYCCRQ